MQQIPHVAHAQAGSRTDRLVGHVFGEFQPDQFSAAVVKGFEAQPDPSGSETWSSPARFKEMILPSSPRWLRARLCTVR